MNLLYMIVEADLNPGLAALMPAVVHEARAGDLRPLLRIYEFESRGAAFAPEDLSSALPLSRGSMRFMCSGCRFCLDL